MRLQNPSKGMRHVFVNEGDIYVSANGSEYSYVTVIDAVSQKVIFYNTYMSHIRGRHPLP